MINVIIAIINVLLLFLAVLSACNILLKQSSFFMVFFTSISIVLALITFSYYLLLISDQSFWLLLAFLSMVNLTHLYWTVGSLKQLLSSRRKIPVDIVPAVIVLLISFFFLLKSSKYGFFDGWALWSSHAKFLVDLSSWKHIFADKTYGSSSDYPLFLPALIAFFWNAIHSTTFIVPLLLSLSFLFLIPLIIYFALKDEFQSSILPAAIVLLFLADYNFLQFASEQCADIPLSVFILMTFVSYRQLKKRQDGAAAYVLGFLCASTAWIKNEGELFFAVFTAGIVVMNYKNIATIKRYLIGSALPLFCTFSFKLAYAPATDFFASSHGIMEKRLLNLLDFARYEIIGKVYLQILVDSFWIGIIFLLVMILINGSFFKSFYFMVIFTMFLGYTFVYLISPYPLGWHVFTSFHRLIIQIYPSFIFTAVIYYGDKYFKKLNIK